MKRISASCVGIDQGSQMLFSDFADGGPMWTGQGDRERRSVVTFATPFTAPPAVQVGVGLWDLDSSVNARGDICAENITAQGFELVFRTWSDTRIARLRADWMAIGPMRDDDDWDID